MTAQNATLADVANQAGTASLADSTAGHVTNADGATFKATGGTLASADNSGSMTLGAGNHVTGDVTNSRGDLTLDGNQIAGTTANHGQLAAQNATLADVANQAGTASLADSTAGHVTNADGATFKATGGTLASADNSGSMTLGAGNHVRGDVTNSRGDLTLDGNQIAGTTANHGQLAAQNATLADVANQAGTASLADSTAGHVTNADGATFKAMGGTLASADNSGSMTLGAGNHVTGDVTNSRGDLTLDGNQIAGTLAANGGSFSVTDHGSDAGSLAGSGNGVLNGTLTLTNAEATLDNRMIAVDAEDGKPCEAFGHGGQVNLMQGMGWSVPRFVGVTSPVPIINGVIVVNHEVLDGQRRWAPSGVIRGYDAESGKFLWAWDVNNPDNHHQPDKDHYYSRGTPNSWTAMTGDNALGLVYVPMGNSSADYYSAMRSDAENKVSSAVVALDVRTGEPRWVFQTVHKDVWDYDIGSQATLFDYHADDGSIIPALIMPTKRGQTFILDCIFPDFFY